MLLLVSLMMLLSVPTSQDVREERLVNSQWAVFDVYPRRSLVTVDSLTLRTEDGMAQVLLPAGKHSYTVESPFHDPATGTFELDAERKSVMRVTLEPIYGLLSTVSPVRGADIYVDYTYAGHEALNRLRLIEGRHSVLLVRDTICYYHGDVSIRRDTRMNHVITERDIVPYALSRVLAEVGLSPEDLKGRDSSVESMLDSGKWSSMSICSNVEGAVVIVNGIEKATTPCVLSPLKVGMRYRITLRKDGHPDATRNIRLPEGDLTKVKIRMRSR